MNPNTEAVMGLRRLAGTALVAVAVAAAPAAAQTVTFSTSGSFSGLGCSAPGCNFGGFVLGFTPVASNGYIAPTFVDLGDFTTQCATCTPGHVVPIASGVKWALVTDAGAGVSGRIAIAAPTVDHNPNSGSCLELASST